MERIETRREGGMTTLGLVVALVLVGLVGFGAWYGYCYYQVLDLENDADKSLEGVGSFRDGKPTKARIHAKAMERIREKGGSVSPEDVRVHVAPLTMASAARLSEFWRQKLTIACKTHGVVAMREASMERMRALAESAPLRGRPGAALAKAPRRPASALAKGCTKELLEMMGYTFVDVSAQVTLKRGLVKRRVGVSHIFYVGGPVGDDRPAKRPLEEDADDE